MKTDPATREILHQTALKAPRKSGVYLWRNSEGTVLYVGKAKNLKNRLSSYFSGQKDIKTRTLISRASSIEYIVTANEYEAFILENNFIKQYNPHFNIQLKDGKTYPLLRITNEAYPRLFRTRRMVNDGSRYFGPFPNVQALDDFLESMQVLYKLRLCRKFQKRDAPCLYYHIGRCSAPCCGKISRESYTSLIGEIACFLNGDQAENIKKMEAEMKEAAKKLEFEKAARIRDGIKAVSMLHMHNAVSDFDPNARDYIGFATEGSLVSFVILKMRHGRLLSRDLYQTNSLKDEDELISEFFTAYYTEPEDIPPAIYVPKATDVQLLRRWVSEKFKTSCKIVVPRTVQTMEAGEKGGSAGSSRHKAALEMAMQNAREDIIRRVRERGDMPAMRELQKVLNLPTLPVRIEGFDIAHIGGKMPVASLISFYNGNPDKKNYRYFRLKTTEGIIDDFASMREATSRRYTRLLNEQAEMPDLIMIDGGIGQVNAVQGVLNALELDIPIVGLAEQDEDLYLPGNSTPIKLPRRSDALRLLQRVRDECHRFATSRNQKLRTKQNVVSRFQQLPHIGKARARIIMDTWHTLEEFARACKEDAQAVADTLLIPLTQVTDAGKAADILLKQAETKQMKAGPGERVLSSGGTAHGMGGSRLQTAGGAGKAATASQTEGALDDEDDDSGMASLAALALGADYDEDDEAGDIIAADVE